ncbi:MAG: hypothetical protein GY913_16660 [Proteobacteria bacterium]|nr:hypothetical protein [Pseudomonadota bacterium]MCP4918537.1 hypothetical protein [Pseudomonadota bacterium]
MSTLSVWALACTATIPQVEPPEGQDSDAPVVEDTGEEPDLHFGGDSEEIFAPETIHRFVVTTTDADWAWLQDHAGDEEYVEATVELDGLVVEDVGLRFKGSWGSLFWCVDGTLDCDKLNLKLDFAEYEPEQRFFDLKKLNFHAMEIDDSNTREHLAYTVWRDAGIPASRTGWATLEVNGEEMGLFLLVEQVDGRFTRHRWGDEGEGDLYKDVWFSETSTNGWESGLETNTDESPTPERMAGMAQDLAGSDDFLATLEQYTDPDAINRFLAVSELTGSFDSIEAFYCGWGDCGNHNFFVYDKGDEVVLIAWDMDRSYDVPVPLFDVEEIPRWYEDSDCERIRVGFGVDVLPPPCDPFFQGFAPMSETYDAQIQDLREGPAELEALLAEVDRVEELIRTEVEADPHGPSVAEWEASLSDFRSDLAELDGRY